MKSLRKVSYKFIKIQYNEYLMKSIEKVYENLMKSFLKRLLFSSLCKTRNYYEFVGR